MPLYITEFTRTGQDAIGTKQAAAQLPPIASQTVAISGASASSAALNADTTMIRVNTDTNCHVVLGSTATTSDMRLPADGTEYFYVAGGSIISVIQG